MTTAPLDRRLGEPRGLDTPWTLTPPVDLASWRARAQHIRQHVLACAGLLPLPERTPLRARVFGRLEGDGYTVEKVHFESLPGLFVCGNLYRPVGHGGRVPGIVSPHGHWAQGRLVDDERVSVPGRGIGLARLGCIAFCYDMAGYNDSNQIDHRRFGGPREDLWGIGVLGLQLWNSLRAVDFLCSLDDVDPDRLGATGASGGGTQTFLLAAVDDRIAAAAPVNMVCAHMQGGCNCENQGHLRLDVNNVEIAACMAPRPLLLVSATGDWTVHTPYCEYPAVRRVYDLFGAGDRVRAHQVDADHNYNRASREQVYGFFRHSLLQGPRGPVRERAFRAPAEAELRVFGGTERMPARALDAAGVVAALVDRCQLRLAARRPRDRAGLARLRRDLGPALAHALSARLPLPGELGVIDLGRTRTGGRAVGPLVERFRLACGRASLPAALVSAPSTRRGPAALVVDGAGIAGALDGRGRPKGIAQQLLAAGHRVLAIDPFLVGAALTPDAASYPVAGVAHFYTYNPAVAAARMQDVLTALAFLRDRPDTSRVDLIATGGAAGVWCLLARALAGSAVGATCLDVSGFRFEDDEAWLQACAVPALRAAGDARTALALVAPARLAVHGAGARGRFPAAWARQAWRSAGQPRSLAVSATRWSAERQVAWLTRDR